MILSKSVIDGRTDEVYYRVASLLNWETKPQNKKSEEGEKENIKMTTKKRKKIIYLRNTCKHSCLNNLRPLAAGYGRSQKLDHDFVSIFLQLRGLGVLSCLANTVQDAGQLLLICFI